MEKSLPLNDCHARKSRIVINRLHAFIHGAAIAALFYYRITSISAIAKSKNPNILAHLAIFTAEFILSLIWLLSQGSKWNPVARTAYPERLPADDNLPAVDVFVCTADPDKEPSLGVMNTVISAMALDYPSHKLHLYLSDDGGSPVTLRALKEASRFAKLWIPFCRKFELKNRCPEAFFLREQSGDAELSHNFSVEKRYIEKEYDDFKISLAKIAAANKSRASRDHPPIIEVINDANDNNSDSEKDSEMPLLVYVAREKRPTHTHNFKAGALNVLLRVSAMISNSPYILVLDCDMYCNNPKSARQAMCFHIDPKLSLKLGFVQFPQKFYNLCDKDIYDGELRYAWEKWEGLNGVKGPILSGTGFYIKREALYGIQELRKNVDSIQLAKCFGSSKEFMKSVSKNNYKPNNPSYDNALEKELQLLASCSYDDGTKWGKQISSPFFLVFVFVFLSAQAKHIEEVLIMGYPIRTCFTEQRIWMIRSLTSYLYANLNSVMDKMGLVKASFLPTNKAVDGAAARLYQMGIYNFEAPTLFMFPLCTLYILNLASFLVGFARILHAEKGNGMLIEAFVPLFGLILHFPLFEGMVLRKDKGRVPPSVTLLSLVVSSIVLAYASFTSW